MPKSRLVEGRRKRCPYCNEAYTEEDMVECTMCTKWIHFTCAGVGEEVAELDWKCRNCDISEAPGALENINVGQEQQPNQIIGTGVQDQTVHKQHVSRHNSISSVNSTQRSSTRLQQKLRILEQEKEILRRQQEILQKEQDLLEQLSDEDFEADGAEVSSSQNHTSALNKVEDKAQAPSASQKHNYPRKENVGSTNAAVAVQITGHKIPAYEEVALNNNMQLSANQIATRNVLIKELPSFSGNPGDWPVFISSFHQSTIACGFSNIENLIRLQRSLKGNAKEAVEAQLTMPSCVSQIIDTLRLMFGRPELIMDYYIDKIRRMPPPRMEKLDTVVSLSVAVRNLCATLQQADMNDHLCNPMLIRELVDKLPPIMKMSWATYKRTALGSNNLSTLGDWLNDVAADACNVMSTTWSHSKLSSQPFKGKKEVLNVHDQNSESHKCSSHKDNFSYNNKCKVCQNNCNTLSSCNKFLNMNLQERWDAVKNNKLCRQCLKRHQFKCATPVICKKDNCERKHHPLLHNEQMNSSSSKLQTESTNSHQASMNVRFRVLPVILSANGRTLSTYAFLDEGSSGSLMSEDIAEQLHLQGNKEPFCLGWSGGVTRIEDESKKVEVNISGTFENAEM